MDFKLNNMKNINIDKTNGFVKMTADAGYEITSYDGERDKIEDFYSSPIVCAPMNADLSSYHAISVGDARRLKGESESAHESMINNNFKKQ